MADDPLAASGSFFGFTCGAARARAPCRPGPRAARHAAPRALLAARALGATDPFFDAAATTTALPFHAIPEGAFRAAFDAHVLGAGSPVAAALQVDGSSHAARAALGDMLNALLGRQASRAELQAWFSRLDFDGAPVIGRAEFDAAVSALRAFSAAPQSARQFDSHARWAAERARHRRVGWELRSSLREPLTSAQCVGWHAAKPRGGGGGARFPLSHTDVTRVEGRSAAHYYGQLP
ncbi:hypothetical protein HT031_005241 [Scenedesmus sp. PABB004]|nr:hypothetical protein HT031_005241 [Scenedesmus sp. PABB004]